MTDIELESLIASLPAKTLDEIGVLASDAFVGHGVRDDGDTAVVLHGIVVYLLRELAPLRALREAVETYFGKYPFSDMGNIERALAACDKASAPTETYHVLG
jgi:Zn-finger domain-containing protein